MNDEECLKVFPIASIQRLLIRIRNRYSLEYVEETYRSVYLQYINESLKFIENITNDISEIPTPNSLEEFMDWVAAFRGERINFIKLNDNNKRYFIWFLCVMEICLINHTKFIIFNYEFIPAKHKNKPIVYLDDVKSDTYIADYKKMIGIIE